jgi:thioredoxin-dependent peroxiredoxin
VLQPGQPAPAFELPDADMQTVCLSTFKGKKHVVLYFYPRDGTPGCTLVTTDFSDHEDQFVKHDCVVLGVSRDDCLTHADFRDRHGVTIALLSDTEGEVCRKYGVLQEKQAEAAAASAWCARPSSSTRRACSGTWPTASARAATRRKSSTW